MAVFCLTGLPVFDGQQFGVREARDALAAIIRTNRRHQICLRGGGKLACRYADGQGNRHRSHGAPVAGDRSIGGAEALLAAQGAAGGQKVLGGHLDVGRGVGAKIPLGGGEGGLWGGREVVDAFHYLGATGGLGSRVVWF